MSTNLSPRSIELWLLRATKKLSKAGVGSARLDALILLEDELARDRAWLLAHPEHILQGPSLKRLNRKLERRASHEPLAYIRQKNEFYGCEFFVNNNVLQPRPESETMIDLVKSLALLHFKDGPCRVVDVGTGSGALAITAKLEIPNSEVTAVDIDPKCLLVARKNAAAHDVKIKLILSDLLEAVISKIGHRTIILANLPYIPDEHKINKAAGNEPKLAIFGGKDGLDLYRRLFEQLGAVKHSPKYVLCESLPPQHKKLASIASRHSYKLEQTDDFIQLFTN